MSEEIAHDPPPRARLSLCWLAAVVAIAAAVAAISLVSGQAHHPRNGSTQPPAPAPTQREVFAAQMLHIPISPGTLTGVVASGSDVWLANWDRGTVTAYDRQTGRTRFRLRVGRPQSGPASIAAGRGAVWVLDVADSQVLRIDVTSGRVTRRGSLAGLGEPLHLTYAAGAIWVTTDGARFNGDSREHVFKLDSRTLNVVAHKGLPGEGPGATVIPDRRGVWVTCAGEPQLALLDPSTLDTIVKTNIPAGQDGPRIEATPSGVWVLSDTDLRRLDPLSAYAATILPTPPLASLPGQLAVDRTGRIWLSDGKTLQFFTPAIGWRTIAGITGISFLTSDAAAVWIASGNELISIRA